MNIDNNRSADAGLVPASADNVRENSLTGFTLTEVIVVIIIIGILATLGLVNYTRIQERALTNEAIANLKLIAAAEKIYRMEANPTAYYPAAGTETDISNINTNLNLLINETNWDYSIDGGASSFTASADRIAGSYSSCVYSINETQDEPAPVVPGDCP